jgi:hypothetical protein
MNNTSAGGQMRTTIACNTGTSLELTPMPAVVGAGASTSIDSFDPTGCSQVVAVITNEQQTAADPTSSILRSYTIQTAASEDGSPPSAPSLGSLPNFRTRTTIPLDWSASSDPQTGIDHYSVQQRDAPPGQPFGPWEDGGTFPGTSHDATGDPGHTYCFRVSATNGAGLTSDWSQTRCTSLPRDDRDLTASDFWELETGANYYLGTFLLSARRGQTLTEDVTAKRLSLIATRCPGCGTVKVFLDAELLKQISLANETLKKRRVLPIANFSEERTGTVTIKIISRAKPVQIDGLGASPL